MICFYHSSDLDGHCSGAIVKCVFPEAEMIGINYGGGFPWRRVQNQDVYMVDFSLQPFPEMERLNNVCNLVWIDHHKTAIEECDKSGIVVAGNREEGVAACALVWKHLHPDLALPRVVDLLAKYDIWDHADPDVLPFQYGMRLLDTHPNNQKMWQELLKANGWRSSVEASNIISKGNIILQYEEKRNVQLCQRMAFPTLFDGLKAIAINCSGGSRLFKSIWDSTKYDLMLTFVWNPYGHYDVGLYTDKPGVDVGELAKRYGGGGHSQAAGFQTTDITNIEILGL